MRTVERFRARRLDGWREGPHLVTVYVARWDAGPLVRIVDDRSARTRTGDIAARAWERIGRVFPGVAVDAYAIFPDRLTGILHLERRRRPFPPPLPALIGWFRSASTRAAGHYVWRRGFDADYLRDEAEVDAVRRFLARGPSRWPSNAGATCGDREVPPAA
jgi:hypothetical protein